MTLLEETIKKLKDNNKTEKDVLWVGCPKFKTTWENFQIITNIEYDNDYGCREIASDLLIVGKDFWLERHECDGSEWWEFKAIPKEPEISKTIHTVTGESWNRLSEMNED